MVSRNVRNDNSGRFYITDKLQQISQERDDADINFPINDRFSNARKISARNVENLQDKKSQI